MPIRVPTYENRISPDIARVPSAPDVPRLELSGGLSAINKVGEANKELGDTVAKVGEMLAKHAQEQIDLKNQQIGQQVYTKYAQDVQDKLFNPDMETVKVLAPGATKLEANGVTASNTAPAKPVYTDVTRPAGVMNRELSQADGAHQELDSWYMGNARNEYLSQIPDEATRAKVAYMMDTHYNTVRGTVMAHQASQGRMDLVNTFTSSVKQQVADAYGASNPIALNTAIDNATLTQADLNKAAGTDQATADLAHQKTVADVTENSVMGKLKGTGNAVEAQALLDSVKEKLSPQAYGDIQTKIRSSAKIIETNIAHNALVAKVTNRFDMVNAVATGKLKWDNSGATIKQVALVDKDLAEAMQNVIESDGKYTAVDQKNDVYQNMVNNIFTAGSNEEVSKFLIEATNKAGNGQISRDRLAILVNAAQNRAKSLPQTNSDGTPLPPTQIAIDGGMKAVLRWNEAHGNKDPETLDNYMHGIQAGKTPVEAYTMATETYKTKINPAKSQYTIGQVILNQKTGTSAEVIGYDDKGSPLVRIKRATASKPTTPTK